MGSRKKLSNRKRIKALEDFVDVLLSDSISQYRMIIELQAELHAFMGKKQQVKSEFTSVDDYLASIIDDEVSGDPD